MPVISAIPQDPTDLVIAGESMRAAAMGLTLDPSPMLAEDPILDGVDLGMAQPLIGALSVYPPMQSDQTPVTACLRNRFDCTMIAANAVISTPCGALIPLETPGLRRFMQSTATFQIVGVTRDSAGSALGTCAVTVLEMGQMRGDGAPVVGQTTSDGSGNYTVAVPRNTAYQVLAYKVGSPDVAGISLQTIVPDQV